MPAVRFDTESGDLAGVGETALYVVSFAVTLAQFILLYDAMVVPRNDQRIAR